MGSLDAQNGRLFNMVILDGFIIFILTSALSLKFLTSDTIVDGDIIKSMIQDGIICFGYGGLFTYLIMRVVHFGGFC